jgi:hypothetical protein
VKHTPTFELSADLLPTHRILQRWAVSIGSGLPGEAWDDSRRSNVPPLDDLTAMIVDQIHCHRPAPTRNLIRQWYLGCGNAKLIALSLLVSRRTVYRRIGEALVEYRQEFYRSRHRDLVALLEAREEFLSRAC